MAHRKLAIFRRRLFTILSVLSLLLCLATLVLWVRSYWRYDALVCRPEPEPQGPFHSWFIQSFVGELGFVDQRPETRVMDRPIPRWEFVNWPANQGLALKVIRDNVSPTASGWFLGFGFLVVPLPEPIEIYAIAFPHWFLALLFAVLPALLLRSLSSSRKRHRAGLCCKCGYDLRATPDRCPECGTANATTEAQRHREKPLRTS